MVFFFSMDRHKGEEKCSFCGVQLIFFQQLWELGSSEML